MVFRAQLTLCTGTVYKGSFKNGTFHGHGTLVLKNGGKYHAQWNEGREVHGSGRYEFKDGLQYDERGWTYCTKADRRFLAEQEEGLKPAGETRTANHNHAISRGCYDVGDGYVDPSAGLDAVRNYKSARVIRAAEEPEQRWMRQKCYKV